MAATLSTDRSSQPRIALGVSGGIAAYKAAEVLRGLQRAGCQVRVGMTQRACEFIQPLTFRALSGSPVIVDDYAPENPDPIAHITFSQTVDLFIVAPATANLIAKFANGIADDFLSSTYLAAKCPVLIAPAMNTTMWQHPATQRNIERLRNDGVHIIEPDAGEMACGTIGPGRLSEPERIVSAALDLLKLKQPSQDLKGERVLITAGATREEIDPVRFISNRSSGKMGFALAAAAISRGATVTLVAGLTTALPPDSRARLIPTTTADEMHRAVMEEMSKATVFIAAAAVADYKPVQRAASKIKKDQSSLTIELERTRDILQDVAASRRPGQLVIGFAAETEDILKNATKKLHGKNLDAIIANDVSRTDSGFDAPENAVTVITRESLRGLELPLMSKLETAHRILDVVVRLREERTAAAAIGQQIAL